MAKKKNYKAMTLRLHPDVAQQIEMRAKVNHRSRNEEIEYLLERALDAVVSSDFPSKTGQTQT